MPRSLNVLAASALLAIATLNAQPIDIGKDYPKPNKGNE